jgi:hypothetical protein
MMSQAATGSDSAAGDSAAAESDRDSSQSLTRREENGVATGRGTVRVVLATGRTPLALAARVEGLLVTVLLSR